MIPSRLRTGRVFKKEEIRMSEIGENLKNFVMKGIEVIGSKANGLASSAKQKVGEFNLSNEQKDLFSAIGNKVFDLYRNGVEFPDALKEDLHRAAEISDELDRIRAEKEVMEKAEEPEADDLPESQDAPAVEEPDRNIAEAEYAAEDDSDIPVLKVESSEPAEEDNFKDCPLSSAINDLFESIPPVDKMMDKVNNSLDELGDNLKKFSGDFGKQLNEFTDSILGKNNRDPQDRT